jgi:HlyD family secretion protein
VRQVRNSPVTVNNVVTYDCVIGVTNADYKLKPGMTANVSINVAHRDNALLIPNGAMRFRPPDAAVVDTNSATAVAALATNSGRPMAGSPGSHAGGGGAHAEHPNAHLVYVLAVEGLDPKLEPVQIKTGISDGIMTEVVSGLEDGAKVVTSAMLPGATGLRPGRPAACRACAKTAARSVRRGLASLADRCWN